MKHALSAEREFLRLGTSTLFEAAGAQGALHPSIRALDPAFVAPRSQCNVDQETTSLCTMRLPLRSQAPCS